MYPAPSNVIYLAPNMMHLRMQAENGEPHEFQCFQAVHSVHFCHHWKFSCNCICSDSITTSSKPVSNPKRRNSSTTQQTAKIVLPALHVKEQQRGVGAPR